MSWISTVSIMLVGSSLASGVTREVAFVGGRGAMRRCSGGSSRCPSSGATRAAARRHFGQIVTMKQQGFGVEAAANKKKTKTKNKNKNNSNSSARVSSSSKETKKPAKRVVAARGPTPATTKGGGETDVGGFAFTGPLRPGVQSPRRMVPPGIGRPDYAEDGMPKDGNPPPAWVIEVKTEQDIAGMRAAGKVAREVLDLAGKAVKVGATTDDVDRACHEAALERGAYPSPLNYFGFPKSCCTSINEIVCHGIPDSTVLEDGMIVNVDVTVFYEGYHGDCSEMFMVGEVDQAGKDLVEATYDIFKAAIAYCKPGRPYSGIGGVIQEMVDARGYSTISNFCGHGIGKTFHANPYVLHHKNDVNNGIMALGHTFTIEPLICEGTDQNVMWPDRWTAATADGKRTAQFEHTFLMTEEGAVPLTAKLASSPRQFWEQAPQSQ